MSLFDQLRMRMQQQPQMGPQMSQGPQLLKTQLPGMNQPPDRMQLQQALSQLRSLNGGGIFGAAKGITSGQLPAVLQLQSANMRPQMVNRFNPVMPTYGMDDYISRMQGQFGGAQGYEPPPVPMQRNLPMFAGKKAFK